MPCCCGKCRCLKAHDHANPTFKWSAWVKMPSTKTGFHFGRNGSLARNVSLETTSYFMWSQSISPFGNPPYYLFGALRLGKTGSRRPRFLVLIDDSSAPTITDARDLDSMPAGVEGALYECTKDGWTLLDYTEYTGAYAAGATNYVFGVTLAGSTVDAVGQDRSENAGDGSPEDRTLLPVNVLCRDPNPFFSPSDPPATIQIQWTGWPDESAYLNGLTKTMVPYGGVLAPESTGDHYDIYRYWLGNPAGGYVVDQVAVGLPGHEIFPLGTNAWSWELFYYRPVSADLVPLVEVRMSWSQCIFEFELNQPPGNWTGSSDGSFEVREAWFFWSQFEHPDDLNAKAHWLGETIQFTPELRAAPVYQTRYRRGLEITSSMGTIASVQ